MAENTLKPRIGDGVIKDDVKNNTAAYKEAEKCAKEASGGIAYKEKKGDPALSHTEEQRGMEGLVYDGGYTDEFEKRVKSQMAGFADDKAEKLHKDEERGNFKYNDKEQVDAMLANNKDVKDSLVQLKTQGLTGRTRDEKEVSDNIKMVSETTKRKIYHFSRHEFITENDMKRYIPESAKIDEHIFYMRDCKDNKYLVEWNEGVANVLEYTNETKARAQKEKMKQLWEYDTKKGFVDRRFQLNENSDKQTENEQLRHMLDLMRKI